MRSEDAVNVLKATIGQAEYGTLAHLDIGPTNLRTRKYIILIRTFITCGIAWAIPAVTAASLYEWPADDLTRLIRNNHVQCPDLALEMLYNSTSYSCSSSERIHAHPLQAVALRPVLDCLAFFACPVPKTFFTASHSQRCAFDSQGQFVKAPLELDVTLQNHLYYAMNGANRFGEQSCDILDKEGLIQTCPDKKICLQQCGLWLASSDTAIYGSDHALTALVLLCQVFPTNRHATYWNIAGDLYSLVYMRLEELTSLASQRTELCIPFAMVLLSVSYFGENNWKIRAIAAAGKLLELRTNALAEAYLRARWEFFNARDGGIWVWFRQSDDVRVFVLQTERVLQHVRLVIRRGHLLRAQNELCGLLPIMGDDNRSLLSCRAFRTFLSIQASVHILQGNFYDAEADARRAIAVAPIEMCPVGTGLTRQLAKALCEQGKYKQASDLIESMDLPCGTGSITGKRRTRLVLLYAEVRILQRRPVDAQNELQRLRVANSNVPDKSYIHLAVLRKIAVNARAYHIQERWTAALDQWYNFLGHLDEIHWLCPSIRATTMFSIAYTHRRIGGTVSDEWVTLANNLDGEYDAFRHLLLGFTTIWRIEILTAWELLNRPADSC